MDLLTVITCIIKICVCLFHPSQDPANQYRKQPASDFVRQTASTRVSKIELRIIFLYTTDIAIYVTSRDKNIPTRGRTRNEATDTGGANLSCLAHKNRRGYTRTGRKALA